MTYVSNPVPEGVSSHVSGQPCARGGVSSHLCWQPCAGGCPVTNESNPVPQGGIDSRM